MFTYFYHENIRKTLVSFATLFNNVYVRETDSDGNITKNNKVPIDMDLAKNFWRE